MKDLSDEGERLLVNNGIRHGSINKNTYTIKSGDPLSAEVECDWEMTVSREGWDIKIFTNSHMTSDAETFYLKNTITAYYNDEKSFEKTWKKEIPRNFQ